MRATIRVDDGLINEALALTQARSKKEVIHLALQELIRARKHKNLFELAGKIELRQDYDHKALRGLRYDSD